jgi:alpha-methylacyl-CoA racemase
MAPNALSGIRIVYLAAVGPVPFATMLLADLGADIVRIDRAGGAAELTGLQLEDDPRTRGQRGVGIALKRPEGAAVARRLGAEADVFLEGMRPGATERLGLGPDDLHALNPRLIYGRMTGWGQHGALAARAGHDINYLALAGALHPLGSATQPPTVPLNLVADFGGGGTYLALAVLAALLQRTATGRGQVLDCAMVDGVASLTTMFHGMLAAGLWTEQREANPLDGAAPWYRCYETRDGGYMAVGAMEPKFYATMLAGLGLDPADWPQHDRHRWADQRRIMADRFAARTRAEWTEVFAEQDACVTPVLTLTEATADPRLRARGTFIERDGMVHPGPAPRLSGSTTPRTARSSRCGHTDDVLRDLGFTNEAIAELRGDGIVA